MSGSDLNEYVGASPEHWGLADECWSTASALVARYVGSVQIPEAVRKRATLEVGAELFHRRNAPGGITQFATLGDASPVRMARNPMVAAYPLLDPFLPTGLA